MDYIIRDRAGSPILDRAGDIIYMRGYIAPPVIIAESVNEHFWCIIKEMKIYANVNQLTNYSISSPSNQWVFGKSIDSN